MADGPLGAEPNDSVDVPRAAAQFSMDVCPKRMHNDFGGSAVRPALAVCRVRPVPDRQKRIGRQAPGLGQFASPGVFTFEPFPFDTSGLEWRPTMLPQECRSPDTHLARGRGKARE